MPWLLRVPGGGAELLDVVLPFDPIDADLVDGTFRAVLPDTPGLTGGLAALLARPHTLEPAPGRDQGTTFRLGRGPRRVGGVWIVPIDGSDATVLPDRLRTVYLHDGVAFGSADHPTTALCLEVLDAGPPPTRVLDVGTGTGVLALAALRLGAGSSLGVDTDPVAVAEARGNAVLNGLADRLEVRLGDVTAVRGRFSLVLANVLAGPLLGLAGPLARVVDHHGELVLSGIAAGLADEVAAPYLRHGFRRITITRRDGWAAVHLRASW